MLSGNLGSMGMRRMWAVNKPIIILTTVVMTLCARKKSGRPSWIVSTLNGMVSHNKRNTNMPAYTLSCMMRMFIGSLNSLFIIVIISNSTAKIHHLSHISKHLGQMVGICDEWKTLYPISSALYPLLLHNPNIHRNFATENF